MSIGIFVSFQFFQKKNLGVFPFSYACLHVISYKCKCVLFYLNMLRLFQDINIFLFMLN
jgi:DMSO/TMAO reductase YedYZ heme-binding membrane subunit